MNDIPQDILDNLNKVADDYTKSKATTNAGRILRIIASIIPPSIIIKIFAHKLTKNS